MFGVKSDADFASWLIVSLEQFVASSTLAYIAGQPKMEARERWKAEQAFCLGVVDRINARLRQLATRAQRTMQQQGDGKSLVAVKFAMTQREFEALGLKLKKGGALAAQAKDASAYAEGRAAGDRAPLGRPVNGGGDVAQIEGASA